MTESSLDLKVSGAIEFVGEYSKKNHNRDKFVFDLRKDKFSKFYGHLVNNEAPHNVAVAISLIGFITSSVIYAFMAAYMVATKQKADWQIVVSFMVVFGSLAAIIEAFLYRSRHLSDRYLVFERTEILDMDSALREIVRSNSYLSRRKLYFGLVGSLLILCALRKEALELTKSTKNPNFAACAFSVGSAYTHILESFIYVRNFASNPLRENSTVEWLASFLEKARKSCDLSNSLVDLSTRVSLSNSCFVGSAHIDVLLNEVEKARLQLEALDEVSASSMLQPGLVNLN